MIVGDGGLTLKMAKGAARCEWALEDAVVGEHVQEASSTGIDPVAELDLKDVIE